MLANKLINISFLSKKISQSSELIGKVHTNTTHQSIHYWEWIFPMIQTVRPSVGRSVGRHNFLKWREDSLPCSYRSTCPLYKFITH